MPQVNGRDIFPYVEKWYMDKLIEDINLSRERLDHKRELSPMHQVYLCGRLAGYKPTRISQILGLGGNGTKVRKALSVEINPYIQEMLGYPDDLESDTDWELVRNELEKAGYKRPLVGLKLDLHILTTEGLEDIKAKIREVAQDPSIQIEDLRRGCIEIFLSGSSKGLKRLESLVKSGELTEINGVRIVSAESTVKPNKVVRLSNWLNNLVESGWKTLEQVLSPQQLELEAIRSNDVRKGKLIDRTMLDGGFAVVLTLKQEKLVDDSFDITLRIYSTGEQRYLPSGIKLRMFANGEDGNEVSDDIQASRSDEWLQLRFTGQLGEKFGVEIVKGEVSVTENFVI